MQQLLVANYTTLEWMNNGDTSSLAENITCPSGALIGMHSMLFVLYPVYRSTDVLKRGSY